MPQLIVFGEDWGEHPSSTQHLMPFIAEQFDVVWINSIGLRRPTLGCRDLRRVWQKVCAKNGMTSTASRSKKAPFPIVAPKVIPLPKTKFGRWLSRFILARQIKPFINLDEPIWVWASLPSAVDYVDLFAETGWFYYCGDDFSALAGVDHKAVQKRELELAKKAALIWVASEKLSHQFSPYRVSIVEHGVDYSKFTSIRKRPAMLPSSGKVLGFYGAVADWVDLRLMAEIAKRRPDWTLMFIGPILSDVTELRRLPNVQFVAPMPHDDLPAFVQHWTAAILPFHHNEQIAACNPLKLREYLASGVPIVSTRFPALAKYEHHVHVVKGVDDALNALSVIEKGESSQARESRQQSVSMDSWQARAQFVKQQLTEQIFAK